MIGLWMSAASRIAPVAIEHERRAASARNSTISGVWVPDDRGRLSGDGRLPDGAVVVGLSVAVLDVFDIRVVKQVGIRAEELPVRRAPGSNQPWFEQGNDMIATAIANGRESQEAQTE